MWRRWRKPMRWPPRWSRNRATSRATAVAELQRFLAQFVAENLTHMNVEESWNNAVLWETHSDAELIAIEQAIVASLSPE